jgi:hypothetical protein
MRTVVTCCAILVPLAASKLSQVNRARPLNRVPSALNRVSEIVVRFGCPHANAESRALAAKARSVLRANIFVLPVKIISVFSVNSANRAKALVFASRAS